MHSRQSHAPCHLYTELYIQLELWPEPLRSQLNANQTPQICLGCSPPFLWESREASLLKMRKICCNCLILCVCFSHFLEIHGCVYLFTGHQILAQWRAKKQRNKSFFAPKKTQINPLPLQNQHPQVLPQRETDPAFSPLPPSCFLQKEKNTHIMAAQMQGNNNVIYIIL